MLVAMVVFDVAVGMPVHDAVGVRVGMRVRICCVVLVLVLVIAHAGVFY
jgi:hypothetical protein